MPGLFCRPVFPCTTSTPITIIPQPVFPGIDWIAVSNSKGPPGTTATFHLNPLFGLSLWIFVPKLLIMSYYQAHVQRLCAAMGVGMSVNGCPVLSRECTPAILDFGAISAASSLVWKPKNNEFTNTVVAAMMEAAVGILLENAPSNPKRHLAQDPDAYPIPVQVRVAQQDAIRTVYKTTVSALLYKGADRQSALVSFVRTPCVDCALTVFRR
jgi:hypothetical protein